MKHLLILFMIIGTIFVLEYEGYYFGPCQGGVCYAIEGYDVSPETKFCDSLKCVEETLDQTGTEHLKNVYKITYDTRLKTSEIKPVSIKYRATIEGD